MPKERRPPQLPNATPTHVVEDLLTLAVVEPTLGCRQYADRLAERGYAVRQDDGAEAARRPRAGPPGPARRSSRGDHRRHDGAVHRRRPGGRAVRVLPLQPSSRLPGGDGQLLHRQPQRRRQGVPADRHRRRHPLGDHAASSSARSPPATRSASSTTSSPFRRLGVPVRAVLTDNGPGVDRRRVPRPPRRPGLAHHRIPPRSPNHNAVCERFQGTALQECWRPAFHRRRFTSIRQLQAEADAWLDALPPPPPQPQRLHARPHTRRDPRQPPSPPSIMTTSHRDHHLSPRPPAGKI